MRQFNSKKFWLQNNPTIAKMNKTMAVSVQITAAMTGMTDQVKAK